MHRRAVLGGVSLLVGGSLAGCTSDSAEETTPENTSQDDPPATDPEGDRPDRSYDEELLGELYDLAAEFRFQASQHFDDGRSHWEGADYRQAMRRFTAAEEKFDASAAVLQRLTTRLETEGLAGFNVADTASRHVGHMHSAARNYAQASVAAADGETTTADSYRESAENAFQQADNYRFADVSVFRDELGTSQ
ncbi:hypothetical protein GRX03_14600 [Halovenus sp. WSH3]|uniref:Uncharacterized protein n=1 Tax=Halovenus carboxidivorans TaxID=2692199 RepID=A0A6B0TC72_9EURY|nr:hypothetical protein [Halovenus carboxidivorans]MXR52831.1 hypothetical protein [Halovenus carboxidivorans]